MVGIADQKLWNLGVGLLSKWNGFSFYFVNKSLHIVCPGPINLFFCFTLRKSSSARLGLGRIAEQVQVLVAEQKSLLISRGNCDLSGESMTASLMQC